MLFCVSAAEVGNFYYGQAHPMKPHRIRMTHNLLINYGLYEKMEIFVRRRRGCKPTTRKMIFFFLIFFDPFCFDFAGQRPHWADKREMTKFHSDDYVDFLSTITPDNMLSYVNQLQMFNVGEDCPVFDGMYEYCRISAGGSIGNARRPRAPLFLSDRRRRRRRVQTAPFASTTVSATLLSTGPAVCTTPRSRRRRASGTSSFLRLFLCAH